MHISTDTQTKQMSTVTLADALRVNKLLASEELSDQSEDLFGNQQWLPEVLGCRFGVFPHRKCIVCIVILVTQTRRNH